MTDPILRPAVCCYAWSGGAWPGGALVLGIGVELPATEASRPAESIAVGSGNLLAGRVRVGPVAMFEDAYNTVTSHVSYGG